MEASHITIKDIAKLAGVSVATVSRVINGTGNVNDEIRVRVQSVIEENDFRPNASARNLKSKKTFTIGLILSDISDRYYSLMTKTIAEVLPTRDYSLIVCSTDGSSEKEKWYFDFLTNKQVDGVILNTSGGLDGEICRLSREVPVVLVNRRIREITDRHCQIDFVGANDQDGVVSLVDLLHEKGHRRIGVINGDFSVSSGVDRFAGFQRAMAQIQVKVDGGYPYRYDGKYNVKTGYDGIGALMACSPAPTAVVTMNDSITIGALKYCREHNIDIPGTLSLVAYGEVDNADLFAVTPTCVRFSPDTIGRRAAQCMFERLSGTVKTNREIVFSSALVVGNSVNGI